jgi:hypothetical protein
MTTGKAATVTSRYIAVPANLFRARMATAGFSLLDGPSWQEEAYERRHHKHNDYAVRIFSSIPRDGTVVRAVGTDAIRICAIRHISWNRHSKPTVFPLGHTMRVYRTGTVEGVLERTIERAREAYGLLGRAIHAGNRLEALFEKA